MDDGPGVAAWFAALLIRATAAALPCDTGGEGEGEGVDGDVGTSDDAEEEEEEASEDDLVAAACAS
jgi:hypothetical protein